MENTCIPVDITGHCLSQRQIRTVIPADGMGFKQAMEKAGRVSAVKSRLIVVPGEKRQDALADMKNCYLGFLESKGTGVFFGLRMRLRL